MKLQILLLVNFGLLSLILAGPVGQMSRIVDPIEKDPLRIKWFLWSDEFGNVHNESLLTSKMPTRKGDITDVELMLYTEANPYKHELIDPTNMSTLISSKYFNPKRPSIFVIHGWNNDHSSPVNVLIRDAFLDNADVNVFVVSWGDVAHKFYPFAKAAVPGIGLGLGLFLQEFIEEFDLGSDDIALIGHSLGAHVAGGAGAAMMTKPHFIIGLDPAGPLFSLDDIDERIDPTDAEFVQVIHTCGGKLAFKSSLGHVDFFPNGGGSGQPGCGFDLFGTCAHGRSYRYFSESLYSCGFHAVQCGDFDDFEGGQCDTNPQSVMGCMKLDRSVHGDFFLKTNDEQPFIIKD